MRCEEDLKLICDRIVRIGEKPLRFLGKQFQHGFKVGAAIVGQQQGDAVSVIQQAKSAMHRTYGQGWNDFESLASDFAERHAEIESYARYALRNKLLGLSFQPQYTQDDEFTGVCALAQMQIPRAAWLAGEYFLPWVEDSELILQISSQNLRNVCLQAGDWHRRRVPIGSLSVAIPTAHFLQADFLLTVFALLDECGVSGSVFEFCLAESTLMANAEATAVILSALASKGVRFCVCGSGLAPLSISHLRTLPIQTLQVSCSETMLPPMYSIHVLRALISHGSRLGLRTRINDVRSAEQLISLMEAGCDAYQGRPLSRQEAEKASRAAPVGPRKHSFTEGQTQLEEAI
jgi:EAL domain-containing protein (putative c-di-GMP-specific phosphodiesterase class I)